MGKSKIIGIRGVTSEIISAKFMVVGIERAWEGEGWAAEVEAMAAVLEALAAAAATTAARHSK